MDPRLLEKRRKKNPTWEHYNWLLKSRLAFHVFDTPPHPTTPHHFPKKSTIFFFFWVLPISFEALTCHAFFATLYSKSLTVSEIKQNLSRSTVLHSFITVLQLSYLFTHHGTNGCFVFFIFINTPTPADNNCFLVSNFPLVSKVPGCLKSIAVWLFSFSIDQESI